MEELAQLNQHQQDARGRLDTIAKSVFLLAGGALTLSINAFTGKDVIPLGFELAVYLKLSWGFLFYSMVTFLLVIASVLLDMFIFGERWEKQLDGGPKAEHIKVEFSQIVLSSTALISFILGFGFMAYVAIGIISA